MRECWVNVYPGVTDPGTGRRGWYGEPAPTQRQANEHACGVGAAEPWMLRAAGVGYRLHVRLKPEPGMLMKDEHGRVWVHGPTSSFRAAR